MWVYNHYMRYEANQLPQLLSSLYRIVEQLEAMFPGLTFAPDGQVIDSLGKALVSYHYGITLHESAEKGHDGQKGARQIQIRTMHGDAITISSKPDYLIAIRLSDDGTFDEVFNGPGNGVWDLASSKKVPKSGQYQVKLVQLRNLMKASAFTPEQQIARADRDKAHKPWMS